MNHGILLQLFYYLIGMIVAVPIFKKLGLGSVLGYLVVGVILGSNVTGLIDDSQKAASHISEFGVIMMLLVIGLEINPKLLWGMRGPIFGVGSMQIFLHGGVAAAVVSFTGVNWQTAIAIGGILALSSTAIVIQTLQEKGYSKSKGGEASFAVLIMQDIAVIPFIALMPILAGATSDNPTPGWQRALITLAAVGAVIGGGRFVLRPFFRAAAALKLRETFTAIALLLVIGTTIIMQQAGLSPALGAFLAGVVLADSEYRHQLEVDLEPFKGLLLGVFFISVGASIDLRQIASSPAQVFSYVALFVMAKLLLGFVLGRFTKLSRVDSFVFGVSLAQGSEFAFVLLALATQLKLVPEALQQTWTSTIALSMAIAPILITGGLKYVVPLLAPKAPEGPQQEVEAPPEAIDSHIIVVGIGRFGQIVVRLLRSHGYATTVLDYSSEQIDVIGRFGHKAYFGDARNYDLLRAAGIDRARGVVLAIDDPDSALTIVQEIRSHHPELPVFSRAFDRVHAYKLLNAGANEIVIETGGSALDLGTKVLENLGLDKLRAFRVARTFKRSNESTMKDMAKIFMENDEKSFLKQAKERVDMLEKVLGADQERHRRVDDRHWESGPRE